MEELAPAPSTGLLGPHFSQDGRTGGVDDVLRGVEQRGHVVAVDVEVDRLVRRFGGDEGAVAPVDVHIPALVLGAIFRTAPRRLGREVEVALPDSLAVRI